MTLYINVLEGRNLPAKRGTIFVEGGNAGCIVNSFKAQNYKWEPPFEIQCSKKDSLCFLICSDKEVSFKQTIKGKARLKAGALIALNEKSLSLDEPIEYSIDVYEDEECLPSGLLKLSVKYDPTKLYFGQFAGGQSLRQQHQRLALTLGPTPSNNFFSLLDGEITEGLKFKFFENAYDD